MIQAIVAILLLLIVLIAFYKVYKSSLETKKSNLYKAFFTQVNNNVQGNLENLEKGYFGWRRLGHGQATHNLKKVIPKNDDAFPIPLKQINEEYPNIIAQARTFEQTLDRIQVTTKRLAEALEGPVRKRFTEDRQTLTDRGNPEILSFRKWLVDREDGWMAVLANIINNEQVLANKDDPGYLYWQYAKESYREILQQYGKSEAEELENLREDAIRQAESLKKEIRRF